MYKYGLRGVVVATVALGTALAGALVAPASAAYSGTAVKSLVPDRAVLAIARSGDRVYIGGEFTTLRNPRTGATVSRSRVAAFDVDTGKLIGSFDPVVNDTVHSISVGRDGTVYLGGAFTSVDGSAANHIAALRADGTALPGWSAGTNNTVYDVWAGSTGVYLAGSFGTVNSASRPRLARLNSATGQVVPTFDAQVVGGRVLTMTPAGDGQNLLVGGTFKSLSGKSRGFSGSVSLSTGAATSWAPKALCLKCYVLDITTGDGRAYAALSGHGGRAVAWSLRNAALAWSRKGDGDSQAIDYRKGLVYVGGHFGPRFAGAERHQLAVLEADRGTLRAYRLKFTGSNQPGIWAVLADGKALRLGGGFKLAGNLAARHAWFPLK